MNTKNKICGHVHKTPAELLVENNDLKFQIEKLKQGATYTPCSGCHETIDGHETGHYPYSQKYGCIQGAGCDECQETGVVEGLLTYHCDELEKENEELKSDVDSMEVGLRLYAWSAESEMTEHDEYPGLFYATSETGKEAKRILDELRKKKENKEKES